jgi:hypothetical protein
VGQNTAYCPVTDGSEACTYANMAQVNTEPPNDNHGYGRHA